MLQEWQKFVFFPSHANTEMPNACLVVGNTVSHRLKGFFKYICLREGKHPWSVCWWPTIISSYKSSVDANHLALSLPFSCWRGWHFCTPAFLDCSCHWLVHLLLWSWRAIICRNLHYARIKTLWIWTWRQVVEDVLKLSPGDGRLIHQPWQYWIPKILQLPI